MNQKGRAFLPSHIETVAIEPVQVMRKWSQLGFGPLEIYLAGEIEGKQIFIGEPGTASWQLSCGKLCSVSRDRLLQVLAHKELDKIRIILCLRLIVSYRRDSLRFLALLIKTCFTMLAGKYDFKARLQ